MDLSSEMQGDIQVITVNDRRIDAAVAIQFKDRMREETESGADHVILNLGNVDFIDSSGLGAIVAAMKQVGGARKLDLSDLRENVDKVFRLTRMDTVFKIHDSLEDALA